MCLHACGLPWRRRRPIHARGNAGKSWRAESEEKAAVRPLRLTTRHP
jgi:hypothetical protein